MPISQSDAEASLNTIINAIRSAKARKECALLVPRILQASRNAESLTWDIFWKLPNGQWSYYTGCLGYVLMFIAYRKKQNAKLIQQLKGKDAAHDHSKPVHISRRRRAVAHGGTHSMRVNK